MVFMKHRMINTNIKIEEIQMHLLTDLGYSFRRFYVDKYYTGNIHLLKEGADVLDIGGKNKNKRGCFDIGVYNLNVKYSNIEQSTEPDYLCDAANIPVAENSFDGIILSEVLEHIENPIDVLREIYRILKPGGLLLMCTPFMFLIHADPFDFARYTDQWYYNKLTSLGFKDIKIERQGNFFSVVGNLLKLYAYELLKVGKPKNKYARKIFHSIITLLIKKFIIWDELKFVKENVFLSGNTTGFGVICVKQ